MKCTKTMLTWGAVILAALTLAYVALPQFRTLAVSVAPLLLALLCPLSMLFMMKGMNSDKDHETPSSGMRRDHLPPDESPLKK